MNKQELIEEMRCILYTMINEEDTEKILMASQILDILIADYYKEKNANYYKN